MKFLYTILGLNLIIVAFLSVDSTSLNYAQAHATGESLEKVVGEYVVDVGYNPTMIEAGSPVLLDFGLLLNETGETVSFSDIWVRIVQENKTIFASGIHKPTFGGTTMVYTFPEAGEYELILRFQEEGNNIVKASFPLTVESVNGASASPNPLLWVLLGVLAGAVGGFLIGFVLNRKL